MTDGVSLNGSNNENNEYLKKTNDAKNLGNQESASNSNLWDDTTVGNNEDIIEDFSYTMSIYGIPDNNSEDEADAAKDNYFMMYGIPDDFPQETNPNTGSKVAVEIQDNEPKYINVISPTSFTIEKQNKNTLSFNGIEFKAKTNENGKVKNHKVDKNGNDVYTYVAHDKEGKEARITVIKGKDGTTEYRVHDTSGKPTQSVVLDENNQPKCIKEYNEDGKLQKSTYCNKNLSLDYTYQNEKLKTIERYENAATSEKRIIGKTEYDYKDGKTYTKLYDYEKRQITTKVDGKVVNTEPIIERNQ